VALHAVSGLISENLLEELMHVGPAESGNDVPDGVTGRGIYVGPSLSGIELFLWAHGMKMAAAYYFMRSVTPDLESRSTVEMTVPEGSRLATPADDAPPAAEGAGPPRG
jgi:hypothetical protein